MIKNRESSIRYYAFLHLLLVIASFSGVCSKAASNYSFLSLGFCFFYGLIILNLMIYAIVWQQIIKKLPLNTAYSNKAVTIAWGILWGFLIFQETIKWNMILGAVIVIIGVIIVVRADE